ncbi:EcsC protein family protein [Pseudomonas helmanticensis]|uniref:EcsC protein family protein n=1 Tax=Pseudomonas helmanticensis TaxID=1471381 RepID=A0ACD2UDK7_9PSED|nr:EcsC family protein [Pseudomonas helmanticensis]SMQ30421.1 EcsC protein family protein [Pseudomonas helmanticensis]
MKKPPNVKPFASEDRRLLQYAKNLLANPGLVAQLTNVLGTPIEVAIKRLPKGACKRVNDTLESALLKCVRIAAKTMGDSTDERSWNKTHLGAVVVTGATAGLLGPWTMLLEIPVTTTIIFRSIADIARSEGEVIKTGEGLQECLKVFALGGTSKNDDATESGYFAVRSALAAQIKKGADFVAKEASKEGTPAVVALIKKVVEILGMQYSEKLAAQLLPIVGAVGGASINAIFMGHFQSMARGHFIVRRLERIYGEAVIKEAYDLLPEYEDIVPPLARYQ